MPSGYWKIVIREKEGQAEVSTFAMPQSAEKNSSAYGFTSTIADVKNLTNFDFNIPNIKISSSNWLCDEVIK